VHRYTPDSICVYIFAPESLHFILTACHLPYSVCAGSAKHSIASVNHLSVLSSVTLCGCKLTSF